MPALLAFGVALAVLWYRHRWREANARYRAEAWAEFAPHARSAFLEADTHRVLVRLRAGRRR